MMNQILFIIQFVNIQNDLKIEFVKNLIKNREYFLPVIYSEWEKDKNQFNN
jgi:hypothetical protein